MLLASYLLANWYYRYVNYDIKSVYHIHSLDMYKKNNIDKNFNIFLYYVTFDINEVITRNGKKSYRRRTVLKFATDLSRNIRKNINQCQI